MPMCLDRGKGKAVERSELRCAHRTRLRKLKRMEWTQNGYLLSDDKTKLDLEAICALLANSYWAPNRPRALTEQSIRHSVCLGLYHQGRQVGFARAVTDEATFAYLCDVIIDPGHRGRGLGKWIVKTLLEHPQCQTATRCLRTRDAHGLYERFGFERAEYMRLSANPP
jgi:GNAT superfamily N-acetyltransferase